MQKRTLGKTGWEISAIGFGAIKLPLVSKKGCEVLLNKAIDGGINFVDTADCYGDSEEKIGRAIREFSRERLVIASKSMARDSKTFLQHLETGLKRLGTDYLDIYHMHALSSDEDLEKVLGPGGAMEGLDRAIRDGKVRFKAFSSHNLTVAKKVARSGEFQIIQYPLNFIDNDAQDELVPLVEKLNMGFIAMKPLGGGLLDDADICFRYLMQFGSVVPDPGIQKTSEMKQIVDIINDPRPLSGEEEARIEEIRREMGKSWCHRCDYCRPCPQGIPISMVLIAKSIVRRMPYSSACDFLEKAMEKVGECTECRSCAQKCPYGLDIPELLQKNLSVWKKYTEIKEAAVFD